MTYKKNKARSSFLFSLFFSFLFSLFFSYHFLILNRSSKHQYSVQNLKIQKKIKFFMFLKEKKLNSTMIYKITGRSEDFFLSFFENWIKVQKLVGIFGDQLGYSKQTTFLRLTNLVSAGDSSSSVIVASLWSNLYRNILLCILVMRWILIPTMPCCL